MVAYGDSNQAHHASAAFKGMGQGRVALVAHAGPVGPALLRIAQRRGMDLRLVPGPVDDALRQAANDAPTRVIALCVDRIEDGDALRAALGIARRAGRHVVVLHAGIAEAPDLAPGLPAQRLRQALLEAEGAITAESHRELLDIAFFLDSLLRTGLPAGRRVAILTGGGGGGVIAADLCGRLGLEVPPLAAATREALVPLVPAIASTANPVDLTPEMFNEKFYDRFPQVLDVVVADPAIDAVFLPTTFNAPRGNAVAAEVLSAFHARSPKPMLIGAGPPTDMQPIFAAAGVAPIADTALAAQALAKLVARAALPEPPARAAEAAGVAWPTDAESALPALLTSAGFTLQAPTRTEVDAGALAAAADRLGFPLMLTALPEGRAIGDVCDAADLEAARQRLLAAATPVSAFALRPELPGTLPLRLLGFRDSVFGAVLALGAGGAQARVLDDLVLAPAPFDTATALTLLDRSQVVAHARRMDRTLDLDAIAAAVARLSQLVAAAPWSRFLLRLDPVVLRGVQARVLDASITIADAGSTA